jgi:hypothetical protein
MIQLEKIIKDAPKPSDFSLDYFAYVEKEMYLDELQKKISEARKVVGNEPDDFLGILGFFVAGGVGLFFESLIIAVGVLAPFLLVRWLIFTDFKKRESQFHIENRIDLDQIKELTDYIDSKKQKFDDFTSSCRDYAVKVLTDFKSENLHNVRSNRQGFYEILDQFEDLVIFFKDTKPYRISYWNDKSNYQKISEFESYISKRREGYKRSSAHQSFQNLIPKETNRLKEVSGTQGKLLATNKTTELATNRSEEIVFVEAPELKVQNSAQPIIRKPSNETNYHNDVSDTRKQDIGLRGELLVLEAEKTDLVTQGKSELANKVEHVSRQGDGHGYDILSYFPNGMKKYVEVKSTTSGSHTSIILTRNEIGVLKRKKAQAFVYLVEGVETEHPRIKVCPGDMFLNTDKYLVTKYAVRLK